MYKLQKSLLIIFALVAFGPTAWAQDLIINSASDWDAFAANVNNGTEIYNGKTVKLNADITVSTMVGTDANRFQGTFNGGGHTITFNKGTAEAPFTEDYCAPFRYIRSATIKNLHTTGTIYTSGMRAGGIVATAKFPSNCNLTSCRSSMTIHCNNNTDCGGLVAHVDFETSGAWRYFNINNCLFDGTLVDDGGSRNWGGFIGWVSCALSTDARLRITNCLFNPVAVPSVNDCKTFARYNENYSNNVNITSCYYKMTLGGVQGTVASDNNATLLSNLGSGWEIVTENNVEKVVPIMISLRPFTGGAGTEESPYQIANATDWDNLAYNVNTCEENYSGKYFKLTNSDLTVTTMVGTSGASFCGTFDGNGNTLTINLTATDNYCAPFRYINGATIKHLHVEGTINGSNKKQLAGLVGNGNTTGTNTISNCSVNVSMTTTFSGDASIGGLIANISTGTTNVEGCAFTGSFDCPNANNVGGLVGWRDWKSGAYATLTLTNCLFMPTSVTFADNANNQPLVRSRDKSTTGLTITNCYITNTIHDGNLQGKQADTITGSNVTVENAGIPSSSTTIGVIGYGTGIKYNNVLYAGDGDNVSLNITAPEGYAINTVSYTYEGGSVTTINPVDGVYSFTMPDANVTINATLWNVYTKDITKYTSDDTSDGWYLISSPIGTVSPSSVINMTNNTYDIFRFNQNPVVNGGNYLEWENWNEPNSGSINHYHFSLEPGRGYLYANSANVTLNFVGTPYSGNGVVDLEYSTTNPDSRMHGWNLIGNPFGTTATVDKASYKMNGDRDGFVSQIENASVGAMEGVFVQATATGQSATFTAQTRDSKQATIARTNIMVSGDHGKVLDNAIIRFDEGETLGKFQLRENSTKVYIPVEGKEYAIANADNQSEMPLNFKAEKNGSYTLSFSNENIEFDYMHLIDNMTGTDIDLLQTPSYTFTAKTTDYESRFKLVFSANDMNQNDNENFAFISNGQLVVNGTGTLQIIDMMGRVIVSRDAARYISTKGMSSGVYVLQLITATETKTQKIIVK